MKNEFKLLVKRDRNGSYEAIEYHESKDVLIERQKQLKQEQPDWEILVVKQNYNVSWKESLWHQIHTTWIWSLILVS